MIKTALSFSMLKFLLHYMDSFSTLGDIHLLLICFVLFSFVLSFQFRTSVMPSHSPIGVILFCFILFFTPLFGFVHQWRMWVCCVTSEGLAALDSVLIQIISQPQVHSRLGRHLGFGAWESARGWVEDGSGRIVQRLCRGIWTESVLCVCVDGLRVCISARFWAHKKSEETSWGDLHRKNQYLPNSKRFSPKLGSFSVTHTYTHPRLLIHPLQCQTIQEYTSLWKWVLDPRQKEGDCFWLPVDKHL